MDCAESVFDSSDYHLTGEQDSVWVALAIALEEKVKQLLQDQAGYRDKRPSS